MTPASSNSRKAEIAALNDEFRTTGPLFGWTKFEGLWLLSHGVQAKGTYFLWRALIGTQVYKTFAPGDDPYGEHDFGAFDIEGERVFWKIDYLQRGTQWGAENPADNANTTRIITIMLAEEY